MQGCNIPQLEVLASLQRQLLLGLALCALETQDDLLGSLGLLVEDRLGLTTITALLSVVTTLTLSGERGLYCRKHYISAPCSLLPFRLVSYLSGRIYLASLVLGDLVLGVLVAVLGLAERPAGFRNVDLVRAKKKESAFGSSMEIDGCCWSSMSLKSEKMVGICSIRIMFFIWSARHRAGVFKTSWSYVCRYFRLTKTFCVFVAGGRALVSRSLPKIPHRQAE